MTRWHQAFRNLVFVGSTGSTSGPGGTKPSETREHPRTRWHQAFRNSVFRTRFHGEHPGTQWHQAFRNSVFIGSTGSTSGPGGTKPSETRSSELGSMERTSGAAAGLMYGPSNRSRIMGGKTLLDVMVGIMGALAVLFASASIMGLNQAFAIRSRARACKQSPESFQFTSCELQRDLANQAVAEKWENVRFSLAWLTPILMFAVFRAVSSGRQAVAQPTPLTETATGTGED
jgi:hypothetical protein